MIDTPITIWESFGEFFVNRYLISGLVLGCIYALGAIGITLTFGILRFANFAHGEVMMLGAYLTFSVMILFGTLGYEAELPRLATAALPLLAAIPAVVLTIIVMLGVDRYFYKPFRTSPTIVMVMASFGMMLMIRALVPVIWGPNQASFVPGISRAQSYFDGAIKLHDKQVLILIGTVLIVAAFSYFLKFTRTGKAMRAVSDSPDLARVTGIDVERVISATWIIGAFCAVAAGVFLAMNTQQLEVTMGFRMLLPMFAAAILGGIGRPVGAIVGGLIIGLAEELIAYPWMEVVGQITWWLGNATSSLGLAAWGQGVFEANLGKPLISPGYKAGVAFAIMVFMLIVRPAGIFKGKVF
ncbi:MAG: branched-chain amino acid ABC transporter permease [Pseudomonadota bacterium]